ncbi:MAG: LysR family transcriptional regulator [Lachnospiraceae bacterium]|nr:LysR family transcriptional regulator [Lachnospiraceae bacterium]
MNLQLLEYAVEVEKTGSITRAAENLYMNQPHLSRAIRELEKEMGIQIFSRTSRGIIPTEIGEEFLKYARDVLAKMEDLRKLREKSEQEKQSLLFVSVRGGYIQEAFVRFACEMAGQREFACHLEETDTRSVLSRVSEKKSRLGIVRYPEVYDAYYQKLFREKDLDCRRMMTMQMCVRISEKHPMVRQENITYLDLMNGTEIVYEDEKLPVFGFREPDGYRPQKLYVQDRDSAYELLRRIPGSYLWEAPEAEERRERPGLVQRVCSRPGNEWLDVAVWRRGYRQTEAELRFLKLVQEEAERAVLQENT